MGKVIDLSLDQGEFRVTPEMVSGMDPRDADEFERRIVERLLMTPGLQIMTVEDLETGDWVIRWRTRL